MADRVGGEYRLIDRSGYTAGPVAGSPSQLWRDDVSTQFVGPLANKLAGVSLDLP